MMRTSGSGREGWMTTSPIAVMVLFAIVVAGGPKQLLKLMEKQLRSTVDWTVELIR
jgi:hypothetical protein